MDKIISQSGGCQCGSIRYRLNATPRMLYVCHCHDCQKQSSSAFGMSLIVSLDEVEFLQGRDLLKTWDTRGGDGVIRRCAFCPQCGSRIYHGSDRLDQPVSIKAGSLDDTGWLRPVAHIWLNSAQPWISVDPREFRCFAEEPKDEQALSDRWRRQLAQE
ncbi:MAG: GFA family protein [Gammaproteobacteria bacterium]|nr:GFA family protein [Gammaproteobacteria bacterium]MDH3534403.1 GFA family protein [Gammaproteobacteria bacterium]